MHPIMRVRNSRCSQAVEMCHHERGFTLIELMVVVVIVGVLSAIAVYVFSKQTNQAKRTEVHAVFAEMKVRQEQVLLETGQYSCLDDGGAGACDDHDVFPGGPMDRNPDPIPAGNTEWSNLLRMNLDKPALLCKYAAVAGPANDGSNVLAGSAATARFGFATADAAAIPDPWYYLIATCDLDNNPGNPTNNADNSDSWYFMTSHRDGVITLNRGR